MTAPFDDRKERFMRAMSRGRYQVDGRLYSKDGLAGLLTYMIESGKLSRGMSNSMGRVRREIGEGYDPNKDIAQVQDTYGRFLKNGGEPFNAGGGR